MIATIRDELIDSFVVLFVEATNRVPRFDNRGLEGSELRSFRHTLLWTGQHKSNNDIPSRFDGLSIQPGRLPAPLSNSFTGGFF